MRNARLPDFLVVGAAKSGTTSLYEYLKLHPEVFVPDEVKETNFFVEPKDVLGNGPRYFARNSYGTTLERYLDLFKSVESGNKAVGEVCPTYLPFYSYTIPNIKKYLGDEVRIIIILRNPVDRAYSHYVHNVRDTDEQESFERALELEEERKKAGLWSSFYLKTQSQYYEQVKAYMENFPQVKVFLYEDFLDGTLFEELWKFLGVSAIDIDTGKRYNVSGIPKSRALQSLFMGDTVLKKLFRGTVKTVLGEKAYAKASAFKERLLKKNLKREAMSEETREELIAYFRSDIEKLSELLDRDLSHWLE